MTSIDLENGSWFEYGMRNGIAIEIVDPATISLPIRCYRWDLTDWSRFDRLGSWRLKAVLVCW